MYQPRKKARRSAGPNSRTLPRVSRSPDEITEAELDTIAVTGTGKIYDQVKVSIAVWK